MQFRKIATEAVTEHGAMQKVTELEPLLKWLFARQPRNVLEIGGMHGGTMWAWGQVSQGRKVCVDLQVLEGRMEHADTDYRLVISDSASSDTRETVKTLMSGDLFDFVFIDGDHRYEAVKADAANWRPLVAPGGAIAFHDICHRYIGSDYHDMWRFWREFSAGQTHFTLYDPTLSWGGVGVVLVPPVPHAYELPESAWVDLPMPEQCATPACGECNRKLQPTEETLCVECAG